MNAAILPTEQNDDAAGEFVQLMENSASVSALDWLMKGGSDVPANGAAATPKPDAASPDALGDGGDDALRDRMMLDGDDDAGEQAVQEQKGIISKILGGAGAAAADVGEGVLYEGPGQVWSGAMDALGEVDDLLNELVPTGGLQITDPETGEFDVRWMGSEEFQERRKVGDDLFENLTRGEADTITGGFVRSTSQFLTGFLPAIKGAKMAGLAKGGKGLFAGEMAAGAIADAVVFDPYEDRLSTYLNEVPALSEIVPDYLADTNPENQSHWEGRMKNAIEGAGLGLAAESLLRVFKYYKGQREVGLGPSRAPRGAQEQAARDKLREAAEADLVQEIPDDAVASLGDPDTDDLLIEADTDETLQLAMQRLGETKARVEQEGVARAALDEIGKVMEGFKSDSPEASPLFEALDLMRAGKTGAEDVQKAMPKRPIIAAIRSRGGLDPKSAEAEILRAMDITPKTAPGLFKKGGLGALDNFPRSEWQDYENFRAGDPDGYLDPQELIDGIAAEVGGSPYRTVDEVEALASSDLVNGLDERLSELNIRWDEMTNDEVADAIKAAEDALDIEAAQREKIPDSELPDGFDPDIEADPNVRGPDQLDEIDRAIWDSMTADERAKSYPGIDPKSNKKQGRIFVNHARIREPDDVKNLIQTLVDQDADAINAKRGGETVTNAEMIKASDKEYSDLTDLIGRKPGPMTAPQAIAARRIMDASGEQVLDLADKAAADSATSADLFNFRRAMLVHYAIQAEVIAARTETARALQSWSIYTGSNKRARGIVCAI